MRKEARVCAYGAARKPDLFRALHQCVVKRIEGSDAALFEVELEVVWRERARWPAARRCRPHLPCDDTAHPREAHTHPWCFR
jgi:hypothetical protein